MSVLAVLLCAGSGTRMGARGNKTLSVVGGLPACIRAWRTLMKCCDGGVVVTREEEIGLFEHLFSSEERPPLCVIAGGNTRQQSVKKGLDALDGQCDTVLIHDGARPLVDEKTILSVIQSARQFGSGIAACPMRDTVKQADSRHIVLSTPDRSCLYAVQTPQGFAYPLIRAAHEKAQAEMTDDAALVEALGEKVHLVMGNLSNIKLTYPEDLIMANAFFPAFPRSGIGYDAHRLVAGRKLVLGGVEIPYEKGLLGHSDADAAVHALIDALLGACALGDIGTHFPDSDNAYLNISSLILLEETAKILEKEGFVVVNCDIDLIAQRPRLSPYIGQMRQNIAQALGIEENRVSVKATTTEHLGFEGRGEGISALAAASVVSNIPVI